MKIFTVLIVPYLILVGISYFVRQAKPKNCHTDRALAIEMYIALSCICVTMFIANTLLNISLLYVSYLLLLLGGAGITLLIRDIWLFREKDVLLCLIHPIIIIPLLFVLFNYEIIPGFIKRDWDGITLWAVRDHFVIWNHSIWNTNLPSIGGGWYASYPPGQSLQSYYWHIVMPTYCEGVAIFGRLFGLFLMLGVVFDIITSSINSHLNYFKRWETILIGYAVVLLISYLLPVERYIEMESHRNNSLIITLSAMSIFYLYLSRDGYWIKAIFSGVMISWASMQRPGYFIIFSICVLAIGLIVWLYVAFSRKKLEKRRIVQSVLIFVILIIVQIVWAHHLARNGYDLGVTVSPTEIPGWFDGQGYKNVVDVIVVSINSFFKYMTLFVQMSFYNSNFHRAGFLCFGLVLILYVIQIKKLKERGLFAIYFVFYFLFMIGCYMLAANISLLNNRPQNSIRYFHPIGSLGLFFSMSVLPFLFLNIFDGLLKEVKYIKKILIVTVSFANILLFSLLLNNYYEFKDVYIRDINKYMNILRSHTEIDLVRLAKNADLIYKNIGEKDRLFKRIAEKERNILIIVDQLNDTENRLLQRYFENFDRNDRIYVLEEGHEIENGDKYDAIYVYSAGDKKKVYLSERYSDLQRDSITYKKDGKRECLKGYSKTDFKYNSDTYKTLYERF